MSKDSSSFEIVIASNEDREKVYAEISVRNPPGSQYDSEVVVEVLLEGSRAEVVVGGRANGGFWTFDFEEFMDALQEAKRNLTGE